MARRHGPPWAHPRWREGHIRPFGLLVYVWIGTAAALGLCLWIAYAGNPSIGRAPWTGVDYAFFVMLGAALLSGIIAARRLVPLWRGRGSEVHVKPMPGLIGGKLRATLYLPRRLVQGRCIRLELINLERTTSRLGRHASDALMTTFEKLFDANLEVDTASVPCAGDRYAIPLDFSIPNHTKDATDNRRRGGTDGSVAYFWMLYLYLHPRASTHALEFVLPVFRAQTSDPKPVRAIPRRPVTSELGRAGG